VAQVGRSQSKPSSKQKFETLSEEALKQNRAVYIIQIIEHLTSKQALSSKPCTIKYDTIWKNHTLNIDILKVKIMESNSMQIIFKYLSGNIENIGRAGYSIVYL
jgi:hypothetical protein